MEQVKLVALNNSEEPTPLFCFPGAGGAVTIFREMTSLIVENQPVYGIDAQDFLDTDREFSVEQIADLCLSVVREKQTLGPYFVCGYSFGALVAYEVATRLSSIGERVGVVALVDTGNPAFIGVNFLLTAGMAALSWHCLEKPALALRDRMPSAPAADTAAI